MINQTSRKHSGTLQAGHAACQPTAGARAGPAGVPVNATALGGSVPREPIWEP
jgi:hypothetical protein